MPEVLTDLTPHTQAKSDQINGDDLLSGPITVTISGAFKGSAEQPVELAIAGHKLYRPCKTCSRILLVAWGKDPRAFIGRSMTLYRDPNVMLGGKKVGGIRISHLSHIERDVTVQLTETRGKKTAHHIKMLATPAPTQKPATQQGYGGSDDAPDLPATIAEFDAGLALLKIDRADFDAWLVTLNKKAAADGDPSYWGTILRWLAGDGKAAFEKWKAGQRQPGEDS